MIGLETSSSGSPMGRYKLLALLGQGGMADVYLAQSKGAGGFQKLLVVKLARFTGDPMYATMFLDEARLAAQLSHPHIVQTYEIGEEGTRHYIVMEYLDGGTLARLRRKAAPAGGLPLHVSLHILTQVLDALDYAHEASGIDGKKLRVVHRDMSPDNVVVTSQGVAKVLDFGISKAADSQSFTHTGRLSGKLTYMPPEQLRGERVDRRADIFAVGVMLAESVLGESLWAHVPEPALASQLGRGEIPSLDRVPFAPELRRICEKALAPNPDDRYQTAGAFSQDLRAFAATLPPVSAQMVGALVTDLLKIEREKLQRTIETALHRDDIETLGVSQALPSLEYTPTDVHAHRPITRREETDDMVLETFPAAAAAAAAVPAKDDQVTPPGAGVASGSVTAAPAQPSRSRTVLIVSLSAGLLAVGAAGTWLAMRSSSAPPVAPSVAAPTVGLPNPANQALPVAPDASNVVRVEILASPAQAVLQLDGRQLSRNPWVGAMKRDGVVHSLVVMAPGHKSVEREFVVDRDVSFDLALVADVAQPPTIANKPEPLVRATVGKAAPVATKPVAPAVVAAPGSADGAGATAGSAARSNKLEQDVYDTKPKRRQLDPNALDTKPAAPTIDRENPWQK